MFADTRAFIGNPVTSVLTTKSQNNRNVLGTCFSRVLSLIADVPVEMRFFLLLVAAPSDQNTFWGRVVAGGGLLGTWSTCHFLTRARAHVISITCRLGCLCSARSARVPLIKAKSRHLCIGLLAPRQQRSVPALLAAGE